MAEGYHDFTAGETLTAANLEDYCQNQSVFRFASAATRDAALSVVKTEGMYAFLEDVNTMTVYSGAAWSTVGPVHGALTSWTPTVTQSGNVTVTNNYSRYTRIGRLIIAWFQVTVTGSGTGANAVLLGALPAPGVSGVIIGAGHIFDTSATIVYGANMQMEAGLTSVSFRQQANVTASDNRYGITGFTAALAVGDTLIGCLTYETSADA